MWALISTYKILYFFIGKLKKCTQSDGRGTCRYRCGEPCGNPSGSPNWYGYCSSSCVCLAIWIDEQHGHIKLQQQSSTQPSLASRYWGGISNFFRTASRVLEQIVRK